jgi:hypothetical protein
MFKKVVAGGALAMALFWGLVFVGINFDASADAEEKSSVMLGSLLLGGPPAVLAGWLFWGMHHDRKRHLQAQQESELDKLQRVFYELLDANQGRVTVFQFARTAEVSAPEAKAYLDDRAKEFEADFDVGDEGAIIYRFPVR